MSAPAAIANAVADALGIDALELPLTPPRLGAAAAMKPAPFDATCAPRRSRRRWRPRRARRRGEAARRRAEPRAGAEHAARSRPRVLVDLNRVAGPRRRRARERDVRVGALVRQRALERSAEAAHLPLVAEALPNVGHVVTRNRGTVGGSIVHADPAAELPLCLVVLGGRSSRSRRRAARDRCRRLLRHALHDDARAGRARRRDASGRSSAKVGASPSRSSRNVAATTRSRWPPVRCRSRTVVCGGAARHRLGRPPAAPRRDEPRGRSDHRASWHGESQSMSRRRSSSTRTCTLRRVPTATDGGARRAGDPPRLEQRLVMRVDVQVNGRRYVEDVEPRLLLSDFLRHTLGLTGTHVGCEHGVCGACTVRIDGVADTRVPDARGTGRRRRGSDRRGPRKRWPASPLQAAFRESHALQCGFCTPGILMSAAELLEDADADARGGG